MRRQPVLRSADVAILIATRLVVWVVRRLGQTDVSGEILAGLLLGPTCLGAIAPGAMHALFDPSAHLAHLAHLDQVFDRLEKLEVRSP